MSAQLIRSLEQRAAVLRAVPLGEPALHLNGLNTNSLRPYIIHEARQLVAAEFAALAAEMQQVADHVVPPAIEGRQLPPAGPETEQAAPGQGNGAQ